MKHTRREQETSETPKMNQNRFPIELRIIKRETAMREKKKKDNRIYGLNRKPENESESNLPIEFKIMSRKTKMKKS